MKLLLTLGLLALVVGGCAAKEERYPSSCLHLEKYRSVHDGREVIIYQKQFYPCTAPKWDEYYDAKTGEMVDP